MADLTVGQALGRMFPNRPYNPNPDTSKLTPFFKEKNYHGYPSREAWSAAFIAKKAERKQKMMDERRKAKIKKEARDIQDVAREYSEKAMRRLVELMEDTSGNVPYNVQADCCKTILERGYGKPVTPTVNANVNVDVEPSKIDVADLDAEVARTIREVRKLTGGEAQEGTGQDRPSNVRFDH